MLEENEGLDAASPANSVFLLMHARGRSLGTSIAFFPIYFNYGIILKSTLASFLSQQREISNIILFFSLAKPNKIGDTFKDCPKL